jgi:hypothetical protein
MELNKKNTNVGPKQDSTKFDEDGTYIHSTHSNSIDLVAATQVKHGQCNDSSSLVTISSLATDIPAREDEGTSIEYMQFDNHQPASGV